MTGTSGRSPGGPDPDVVDWSRAGRFAVGDGHRKGGTALQWGEKAAEAEARLREVAQQLAGVGFQTMLAVHALLILCACWLALSRRRWSTAVAWLGVIGFSLLWFGVNRRWEGRILYEVTPRHGLTQADLVVPGVIAAALLIRGLRYLGRSWVRRRQERINAGIPSVFRTMWPKA